MTSHQNPNSDQQLFDELRHRDRFDDSIGDQHRRDLRSKVLQAVCQPADDETVERRATIADGHRRWRNAVSYVVILAGCVMVCVAAWILGGGRSAERHIIKAPPVPQRAEDSPLLASLTAVNSFREEVSPEALFGAFAICELAHEERERFDVRRP